VTRIVDLSQEIYQGMPVYPGHLNTVIFDYHTHASTQGVMDSDLTYATHGIILSDHGPTHVDSLSHFDPDPDAPTIDEMGLELFFGPGVGKRFEFYGLPLKARGGQGSPVRAVALLDD
jgi:kynurenine formamidase